MREIKFRAWDKKLNEWVHKAGCNILGETILLCGWMQRLNGKHVKLEELNDIEVMQYTGLKDKNGVEIYEGDILKWENQERPSGISDYRQDQRFVIKYDISYFLAENIKYNEQSKYYGSRYLHNLFYPLQDEIEVIGNIYENPELLK